LCVVPGPGWSAGLSLDRVGSRDCPWAGWAVVVARVGPPAPVRRVQRGVAVRPGLGGLRRCPGRALGVDFWGCQPWFWLPAATIALRMTEWICVGSLT